jgi:ribonuclease HIII
MNKSAISIKASAQMIKEMKSFYDPFVIAKEGDYILFCAKKGDVTITAYTNTKGKDLKVTFTGAKQYEEARRWDANIKEQFEFEEEEILGWFDIEDQIGSDEVGTGDFFGPITVCATLVRKSDVPLLRKLGVADSKKLSDDFILNVTPQLLRRFTYSQLSLSNEKYNSLVRRGMNMNEIKSRLHNRALLNLLKKNRNIKHLYIDKFVSESKYFAYAQKDSEIAKNIVFKTKGESRFPSVALASVIARYSFLVKMASLSEKYGMQIPFGASQRVDAFAQKFIDKFGLAELDKVAKTNFKNYQRLLKDIQ